MKQLFQNMRDGSSLVVECPRPTATANNVVIESIYSLISVGTERMIVGFSKSNYLQKALQQPDKVKQVLEKMKTDGVLNTLDAVNSKLDTPIPLGYNNVGRIIEVGSNVGGFKVGDIVVSNGPHASHFSIGKNLIVKIPDSVDLKEASFTVVGAIALQGIRLANPSLGEYFMVSGAGLIGLIAVQLLIANGCKVLAVDFDADKLALAKEFGADTVQLTESTDLPMVATQWSQGRGVDGVIVTTATTSSDPMTQAAQSSRKRGRIILVGVSGLGLNRADFYEKELSFQVSCSYGPGRYDKNFEEMGVDYPIGYVRWTQQRNFEAFIDLLSSKKLNLQKLLTHSFSFDEIATAYDEITENRKVIGAILDYKTSNYVSQRTIQLNSRPSEAALDESRISFIGAGNYASRVLIPSFKTAGAKFGVMVTRSGGGSSLVAKKFNFQQASTELDELIQKPEFTTFAVTTQHNSHASIAKKLILNNKNVFVEKPLSIDENQLEEIKELFVEGTTSKLMVGYNRRFSPHGLKMKSLLDAAQAPKFIIYNMNAGALPKEHWARDLSAGGGRIVGEACHAIDFVRYLVGKKITHHSINCSPISKTFKGDVVASINLIFEDGSQGVVNYFSSGSNTYPKESVEVHCAGKTLKMDNFLRMKGYNWNGFSKLNLWRQDKGQVNCCLAFLNHLRGGPAPISLEEIFEVAKISIQLQQSCNSQGG